MFATKSKNIHTNHKPVQFVTSKTSFATHKIIQCQLAGMFVNASNTCPKKNPRIFLCFRWVLFLAPNFCGSLETIPQKKTCSPPLSRYLGRTWCLTGIVNIRSLNCDINDSDSAPNDNCNVSLKLDISCTIWPSLLVEFFNCSSPDGVRHVDFHVH